jgi:hypothetical protein
MRQMGPPPANPDGYTVDELCSSIRMSRTRLYEYWKAGKGPRFIQNGARRIITRQAKDDWLRELEAESAHDPVAAA